MQSLSKQQQGGENPFVKTGSEVLVFSDSSVLNSREDSQQAKKDFFFSFCRSFKFLSSLISALVSSQPNRCYSIAHGYFLCVNSVTEMLQQMLTSTMTGDFFSFNRCYY